MNIMIGRDESTDVYWVPLTVECYLNCCDCNHCKLALAQESSDCIVKFSVQQLLSKGIYPQLTGKEENDLYIDDNTKEQMMKKQMFRRSQSKGILIRRIYADGNPYSFSDDYEFKVYKSKAGHPMFNVARHYQDAYELACCLGKKGLECLYTKDLHKTSDLFSNPKASLMLLANLVWDALNEIAEDLPVREYKKQSVLTDKQIEDVKNKKSPGRPKMDPESRIFTLNTNEVDLSKLPPQAQACVIILKGIGKNQFSIAELKDIFDKAQKSGALKTRQNPYRIFDYYKNRLKQRGVINYD